ncbi:unnamed protein product [Sphagnum jensenii]
MAERSHDAALLKGEIMTSSLVVVAAASTPVLLELLRLLNAQEKDHSLKMLAGKVHRKDPGSSAKQKIQTAA